MLEKKTKYWKRKIGSEINRRNLGKIDTQQTRVGSKAMKAMQNNPFTGKNTQQNRAERKL